MGIYDLYGLKIKTSVSLLAPLLDGSEEFDLTFEQVDDQVFENIRPHQLKENQWFYQRKLEDGSRYVLWPKASEFLIHNDQKTIKWFTRLPNVDDLFRNYFFNQILAFSLLHRGIVPIHGVVLAINGKGVLFLGDCGYGKSTLAAWFLAQGHHLVTDDLVVFKKTKHKHFIYPGLPRIKLFPEALQYTLGNGQGERESDRDTKKRSFPIGTNKFWSEPIPLHAIYDINAPHNTNTLVKVEIKDCPPHKRFLAFIENTFNAMDLAQLRLQNEFQLAYELSKGEVPIKELSYRRQFNVLPEVYRAVMNDLEEAYE